MLSKQVLLLLNLQASKTFLSASRSHCPQIHCVPANRNQIYQINYAAMQALYHQRRKLQRLLCSARSTFAKLGHLRLKNRIAFAANNPVYKKAARAGSRKTCSSTSYGLTCIQDFDYQCSIAKETAGGYFDVKTGQNFEDAHISVHLFRAKLSRFLDHAIDNPAPATVATPSQRYKGFDEICDKWGSSFKFSIRRILRDQATLCVVYYVYTTYRDISNVVSTETQDSPVQHLQLLENIINERLSLVPAHLDQQPSRNGGIGTEEPSQRKLFSSDQYGTRRTEGLRRVDEPTESGVFNTVNLTPVYVIYGQYKINGSLLLYTPAYAQQHSKEFASLKSSVCEGVKYVYILGGDVTQEDIKSCDIFVSRRKVLDSSSSGWPVELTLQMVMDRYLLDLHNGSRTELVDYLSAIYMQLQPIVGGILKGQCASSDDIQETNFLSGSLSAAGQLVLTSCSRETGAPQTSKHDPILTDLYNEFTRHTTIGANTSSEMRKTLHNFECFSCIAHFKCLWSMSSAAVLLNCSSNQISVEGLQIFVWCQTGFRQIKQNLITLCFLEVITSGSLTYTDDKKSDRTTSQSGQTSQTDLYRVDEITQNLTVHSQNSQEFGTASSAASKNELNFCMQIRGTFSISGQKLIYRESYKETTSKDFISLQQSVCDHIKFVYIYGGNIPEEYITSCMLSVTTEKDAVEVNSRDQFAELCLELVFGALTRKMIPNGQQNVVYHLASIYLELRPEVEDTEAFSEEVQFFECFLKTTTPNHFGYLPKLLSEQNTIHFGLQSKADSDNEQKATEDLYLDSEASQEVGTIVSSTSEKASDLICRLERSLVVAFDCLRLLSTINSGCVWCIVIHQAGSSLAVTGQLRIIPSVEDSERYEAQLSVVRRKYTSSSMPNFETLNLFSKTSAYSGSAEEANVDHTPTNSTLTFVTHTKPNNANADKSTVPYSLISMEISEETISPGDFCMRIQGTYLLNGETVMYHETYHESISEDFQNLQQSVCNHVKFIYIYGGNVPEEYIVTCTLMVTAGTDEHAEAKLPKIYAELSLDLVFAAGLRNIFRSVQPNPVRHLASIYFELQPTLGDNEAFSDGVRFSDSRKLQYNSVNFDKKHGGFGEKRKCIAHPQRNTNRDKTQDSNDGRNSRKLQYNSVNFDKKHGGFGEKRKCIAHPQRNTNRDKTQDSNDGRTTIFKAKQSTTPVISTVFSSEAHTSAQNAVRETTVPVILPVGEEKQALSTTFTAKVSTTSRKPALETVLIIKADA
ncbi:hypothetical protein CLF_110848 [Clonorchis sinensis]|uniref:Uncharacterized protein n=1 Tax=Clonorchis sinensis TaxID=79923 RepID=G7YTZ0_CLOSI|nr:hypothetical protein CLF_110848 [Clonorchis sinensis]